MKRIFVVMLVGLLMMAAGMTTNAAAEGVTGAIHGGIGTATTTGGIEFGLAYQVLTLQASGMLFPNEWLALMAGISYGLPHDYEYSSSGGKTTITGKAAYADGLIGVYKPFSDGGFIYLAGGVTAGWGSVEVDDPPDPSNEYDIDTGIGLAFGAGIALPIADNFMGVLSLRQRYMTNEFSPSESGEPTMDLSLGGLDMGVGFAYYFGK